MSRLQPGHKRRLLRLEAALVAVGGILTISATFLSAWPFPFHVPPILVLLPSTIGVALLAVALVLFLRDLSRLPKRTPSADI
jgi:hypothetical protein